jgi:hypothetical protein
LPETLAHLEEKPAPHSFIAHKLRALLESWSWQLDVIGASAWNAGGILIA